MQVMYTYSVGLLWRGHPLFWPDSPVNSNDEINCLFKMKASDEIHLWFLPVIFFCNLACLEGRVLSLKAGRSAMLKADICCIKTNKQKQGVLAILTCL